MQRQPNVLDMFHGDNREAIPNFALLKQNGIFATIHKVGEGANYLDPRYIARRAACLNAGMLWGGYWFLDHTDPIRQADRFMQYSKIFDADGSPCMMAVDYEKGRATPTLTDLVRFMSHFEQQSKNIGVALAVYSSDLIRETLRPLPGGHQHPDMINTEQFFQQHRLWLAEYGPHTNIPWPWNVPMFGDNSRSHPSSDIAPAPGIWLWQYSDQGRVNPVVGKVDLNFYNGTEQQLSQNWLA